MKVLRTKGVTDQTLLVFVQDSSSTTGDGLTGITASMLTAYYARVEDDNDVVIAEISLIDAVGTGTAHADGVWEEISPNMPGWYRLDPPDACFATGASECGISLIDSASNNVASVAIEIQLINVDLTDSVRMGITALPNAAADAAGGLPISDAGGLDLDAIKTKTDQLVFTQTNQVDANIISISNDPDAADNLEADYDGSGYAKSSSTIGTVTNLTGHTKQTGDNFARIGVAGAGLTDLGGMSTAMKAEVNTEVDTGLSDIHLDHLLAVDYDPASKPGTATALLNEIVENDSGVSRFTVNALENAPSGSGASAAAIADAVWDEAQADHVAAGSFGEVATEVASILVDTGTTIPGTITTAQADLDIITGADGVNLLSATQASIDAIEVDTSTTLDTKINDIDTVVDAILVDTGTTLPATLTDIAGATFVTGTDSLEAIRNRGDAAWTTGAGGSAPTVEDIRAEMDSNSTQLAAIVEDTGTTLPSTLAVIAGYLDTEVAAILVDTGTTIPALIATAQADLDIITGADGVNLLSATQASIDAIEVDTGTTLDTKINTIDTNVDSILVDTDTTIPGLIAALNDPTAAAIATAVLTTQMTESYAADGTAPTLAQSMFMIWAGLSEFAISGTTITAKKLDGSTTAMTFTLDDASDPTSRTRAT